MTAISLIPNQKNNGMESNNSLSEKKKKKKHKKKTANKNSITATTVTVNDNNNTTDEEDIPIQEEETSITTTTTTKNNNMTPSKERKRKRHNSTNEDESSLPSQHKEETSPSKEEKQRLKLERKAKKSKRKSEKFDLLDKVPKVDENGISYTKIQIRRMLKRVKRGLPPVLTEKEEQERLRQLKLEKKEEEDELAGMFYNKDGSVDEEIDDHEEEDGNNNEKETDQPISNVENPQPSNVIDHIQSSQVSCNEATPSHKKKKRSKPIPEGYKCSACQNKHTPAHWIYDCPDKIRKPGCNKVAKKLRGINEPASHKVFVSGLPFDTKTKDVENYFQNIQKCGTVVHCKLLTFEDTKRCKGQGIVTFDNEDGAKNALKLNKILLDLGGGADAATSNTKQKKNKKGDNDTPKTKKELVLGVSKVFNRLVTKKGGNYTKRK
mmetsp:Transcript_10764/g.15182  ORF Transcript_10764/g.15182 Transcript_10764/m.15182 type:complete len:436 (-) Transcript_10764:92-1399(-)